MTLLDDLPPVRADELAKIQMCGARPGGSLDRSTIGPAVLPDEEP